MDKPHIYSSICRCVECYKVKALIDITHWIEESSKKMNKISSELDDISRKLR